MRLLMLFLTLWNFRALVKYFENCLMNLFHLLLFQKLLLMEVGVFAAVCYCTTEVQIPTKSTFVWSIWLTT